MFYSEKNIPDMKLCCRPLFCHSSVVKYISSLLQQWRDLATKYYWNRPLPNLTGWIRPWFITIGKDWNKDRFNNWQLCGVCKLPFCDHRAINFTQNCVSFTNPCISLLTLYLPSLVSAKPRYFNFSTCCSVLPLTCSIDCIGFVEKHSIMVFLLRADFHSGSVARSRKPIKCMLNTLLRRC